MPLEPMTPSGFGTSPPARNCAASRSRPARSGPSLSRPIARAWFRWDGLGDVRLWDVATGKEIRRFEGHRSYVSAAAFSPDGWTLATRDETSSLRLWEITTAKERLRLSGNPGFTSVVT